jgi:hypothetical protein
LGKNTNKSRDPKNSYPEINFNRLKIIASDWSKRYPGIGKIVFYPHGAGIYGKGKKYFIDISLDNSTLKEQIEKIESSIFLNELLDAQNTDNSFKAKEWRLYFRLRNSVLPLPFILDVDKNVLLFKKPDNSTSVQEFMRQLEVNNEPIVIIDKRNEQRERTTWKTNIQPIVDLHYNGVFKYKFFPDPNVITDKDLNLMLRKTTLFCYRDYDLIFPTSKFGNEFIHRLHGNQKQYEGIDIEGIFFTFLSELFKKKTLPIFLEHLYLDYGLAGISPQEKKNVTDISISKDEKLKWEDIIVTFLNSNEIHIQFKNDNVTRHYKNAGFGDRRGGGSGENYIIAWQFLFKASKTYGTIPWKTFQNRKYVEKHVQNIRKKFRVLFPGIDRQTDPIPLDKKNHQYKTTFSIKPPYK